MDKQSIGDRVAGAIFVVMGIISLVESWRLYNIRTRGVVGDDTFPFILGSAMVVLGAVLAFFPTRTRQPVTWPNGRQAARMAAGFLMLVLFSFLLPFVGFPVATFIASLGLFVTLGRFRWYMAILISAALSGIFHAIFVAWLNLPFPKGLFGV
ncbi:MAG TPA: tripartite tricarboxylate transporter TctB family protein [Syntrophorhabdaceae bacterium]|nr:tripartite tricarboxylate transporter TctB family protein [Syntrophorhabdaceae bacterium]HQM80742.1 tripartite tricarboxylate transporter TctB family protein [Syntrophorhabdaceae bacterium]